MKHSEIEQKKKQKCLVSLVHLFMVEIPVHWFNYTV